jgi:hypothetical protein
LLIVSKRRPLRTAASRPSGESVEAVSAFLDRSSLRVTSVYLRPLEGVEDTR